MLVVRADPFGRRSDGMRVRIDRRIHADGKIFYPGDVVELAKYPELRRALSGAEEQPKKKTSLPARDKMVRSVYGKG